MDIKFLLTISKAASSINKQEMTTETVTMHSVQMVRCDWSSIVKTLHHVQNILTSFKTASNYEAPSKGRKGRGGGTEMKKKVSIPRI